MSEKRNQFKGLIVRLYGSQRAMSKALGVSGQTVQNWVNENPRGMLSHVPEIVGRTYISYEDLIKEIVEYDDHLNELFI